MPRSDPHVDLDTLAGLVVDDAHDAAHDAVHDAVHDAAHDDVRRHVEACAECGAMLAALTETRALVGEGPLVAPPAHLRDQVLAHLQHTDDTPVAAPIPLPVGDRSPARQARRGVPAWAAGLAAAAALVAGLGLGRLTVGEADQPEAVPDPTPTGTVVGAADLTALDSDAPRGEASAVRTDDTVKLRVRARELGDEDGFHEVWLINVDGKRMVALGVLAPGDLGEFEVPRGLIDEGYRIVDISVEPDDGDPTHSGVSLARGELA